MSNPLTMVCGALLSDSVTQNGPNSWTVHAQRFHQEIGISKAHSDEPSWLAFCLSILFSSLSFVIYHLAVQLLFHLISSFLTHVSSIHRRPLLSVMLSNPQMNHVAVESMYTSEDDSSSYLNEMSNCISGNNKPSKTKLHISRNILAIPLHPFYSVIDCRS